MSLSVQSINPSNYSIKPVLQSSCTSLSIPVIENKIPQMILVYLSVKHTKNGEFTVKPISLKNKKSLIKENTIKSEKRLAIIQEFADGIVISMHSQHTTRDKSKFNLFIKNINENPQLLCRVGLVLLMNDETYSKVNLVYEQYLTDIEKKLASTVNNKVQNNNHPDKDKSIAPSVPAKEDKCVIC